MASTSPPITASEATPNTTTKSCAKCRSNPGTFDSRGQLVCRTCFQKFISAKCIKQIGLLNKDVRSSSSSALSAYHSTQKNAGPPQASSRRYLLGLSLGPSSAALLELLNENVEFQLGKGRNAPFELVVVHVSSEGGGENQRERERVEGTVQRMRERYPRFEFKVVYLEEVVGLETIDWAGLGLLDFSSSPAGDDNDNETTSKAQKLRHLFDTLPSTTSRTDLLRLFTRHLLISEARKNSCHALLLGSSTTALAELTLSETAKGRGFSLPWQINDGILGVPSFSPHSPSTINNKTEDNGILVYHPLRDALRKELVQFTKLTDPPIFDMLPEVDPTATAAVVSHKDLSIEEVMVRYFADVEENYPSIVANVARTTGKLLRLFGGVDAEGNKDKAEEGSESESEEEERLCGLCNMPLDEFGDERWKGELGEDSYRDGLVEGEGKGEKMKQRICYGCERSVRG
ncbi:hypothetical protein B0T20DRAFT_405762 [Sordaria brevicollis]|uniref:Cytoplasmic tRNA 2-thiolation protein 2 n=1 Tax=Sordaria brevicollis TaxID=83679 RepID=A0AAE0UED4_SORBR|nr:hypothetical protein B0T20DRAFT_405762 [Sordaria brevicollis]